MNSSNINYTNGYLAGVMDSDGSFSISKRHLNRSNPNYTVMLQISWNYSKAAHAYFSFLKREFGGSYCIGPHHKSGYANASLTIRYSATGKAAERILLYIRKSLVLKNKQAIACLKLIEIIRKQKEYKGKPRPKTVSIKLEKLYIKNKKLNMSQYKL